MGELWLTQPGTLVGLPSFSSVHTQGKSGMDMYKEFEVDRDQGNFDKLPELHAVLSGMKVGPPSRPV